MSFRNFKGVPKFFNKFLLIFLISIILLYSTLSILNLTLIGPNENEEFFFEKDGVSCIKEGTAYTLEMDFGPLRLRTFPPLIEIDLFERRLPVMTWPHNFALDRIFQNIMISIGQIFSEELFFSRLSGLILSLISLFVLKKTSDILSPWAKFISIPTAVSFSAFFFVPLYHPAYSIYFLLYTLITYYLLRYKKDGDKRALRKMRILVFLTTFSYLPIGIAISIPVTLLFIRERKEFLKLLLFILAGVFPYILQSILSLPLYHMMEEETRKGAMCGEILINSLALFKKIIEIETEKIPLPLIFLSKVYLTVQHIADIIDFRGYGHETFFNFSGEVEKIQIIGFTVLLPMFFPLISDLNIKKEKSISTLLMLLILYVSIQPFIYGHMRKMIYIIPVFSLALAELIRVYSKEKKFLVVSIVVLFIHIIFQNSRTIKVIEKINEGNYYNLVNTKYQRDINNFLENIAQEEDKTNVWDKKKLVNFLAPINLEVISGGKTKLVYITFIAYYYHYFSKEKKEKERFYEEIQKVIDGKLVVIPSPIKGIIENGEEIFSSEKFSILEVRTRKKEKK